MSKLNQSQHDRLAQSQQERDEIDYFEQELERISKIVKVPLMTRRQNKIKEDPFEELMEVYQDVKEIEQNL
jgi:hypothetical protein